MTLLSAALALTLALAPQESAEITRDSYGVATITATTTNDAFRLMGQVVATDRLWQMELSRRAARGRLAEVFGESRVASDKSALSQAYTDAELRQMVEACSSEFQARLDAYVEGVNQVIARRKADGTLPRPYAAFGFEPEPWTTVDSAAIMVQMARRFGSGGAGELRNYALLQYLRTRPNLRDTYLDALDDLAWQNDPESVPTVLPTDDPVTTPPTFPTPTRAQTLAHIDSLPKTTIFELLPAISFAQQADLIASSEQLGLPHKAGSYAVIVAPARSRAGNPLLLSAPQMGHTVPNVVHEVDVRAPGYTVGGMDVPGIPGVLVGWTPEFAWGLTSGVADVQDIFVSALQDDGQYVHAGSARPVETITFDLPVKGGDTQTVVQRRTVHGPVVLESKPSKALYSQKSSFYKREITAFDALVGLTSATTPAQLDTVLADIPLSFNFFFAFNNGDIGWRYVGDVPVRAATLDPRFPTPDTADNQWKGMIARHQMPRVDNPANGLIVNWNNKPAAWWPNLDTPVWGRSFRNETLIAALPTGKIGTTDLQVAVREIAQRDTLYTARLADLFTTALTDDTSAAATHLRAFDGLALVDSPAAYAYNALRIRFGRAAFEPVFGNFLSPDLFDQIVQLPFVERALAGATTIDYFADRPAAEAVRAAMEQVSPAFDQWRQGDAAFGRGTIPGMPASRGSFGAGYSDAFLPEGSVRGGIPYNNRGTYIQITELGASARAWSVLSPGVTEEGVHSSSQAPLAAAWAYRSRARF